MFSLRVSWESWDGVSATPFRNHGNSNNYVELNPIVLAEQKEKYRSKYGLRVLFRILIRESRVFGSKHSHSLDSAISLPVLPEGLY